MRIFYAASSQNSKTGCIPVSYIEESTCPTSCPLKKAGCYAEAGHSLIQWRKTGKIETSISFEQYLKELGQIEKGRLSRYGVAGDLPGIGDTLDSAKLDQLTKAARHIRLFAYTHKPLTNPGEQAAVANANVRGFTINLSADNLQDADKLMALGIAPVVVIIPSNPASWPSRTPEGRKVVVCPNTTHGVTCLECRLCAIPDRRAIIGFPSHGNRKRLVDAMIARAS